MPKLRNRNRDVPLNGKPPLRSSLADAAWAVEDKVVLGAADVFHGVVEAVRWPAERVSWAVEHWLVWPIEEEAAGWSVPVRAAALAGIVLLAAAGVAAGIAVSTPSGAGEETSAPVAIERAPVTAPVRPDPRADLEEAKATGPVLHGTQPEFTQESGGGIPESARAEAAAKAEANEGVAAVTPDSGSGSGAKDGPAVAGPEAIDVARQFAGAFVLYETGRTDAKVRRAFAKTTSPELEQALLKRPPRLPANVKVPKAKVLNIVSGPKSGDAYTLSVSLLRVGVTSELRIDMEKGKGRWLVTDVRG